MSRLREIVEAFELSTGFRLNKLHLPSADIGDLRDGGEHPQDLADDLVRDMFAEFGDMPIEALDGLQDVLETRWTLAEPLPDFGPSGE